MQIPLQISSHFDSMLLNMSKFDDYCFYLYRYRDALHWKRKGVLCVGVCSIIDEQDCAACICEGVLKTVATAMHI